MKKSFSPIFILLMLLSSLSDAKHVKLYVLTGQSNALGTTTDKSDKDTANPPAFAFDKEIPFYWSNRSNRMGNALAAVIGDSGGKISTLQKQQGEGDNPSFWGPEISFGRTLYSAGRRDFMIIKACRGGGGNGHWAKGGQMNKHILDTVKLATAELDKQGHTYEFSSLLYVQGESNAVSEAKIAAQRFSELLSQLREQLPNAKKMNGVIGGIAAKSKWMDHTRLEHKELGAKRNDIEYFSTVDLRSELYDNLHFSKKAKIEVGQRFAKAVEKLEKSAQQASPQAANLHEATTPKDILVRIWWKVRHEQKLKALKTAKCDILFIGDSITHGWERKGKQVWEKHYGKHAFNIGYGGDQTQNVLWRIDNGEMGNLKPKVAVLMIGTNNTHFQKNWTAQKVADGIQAIIQRVHKKSPDTKVLLLAIFPRGANPDDPKRQRNDKTNALISKLHDGDKTYYLDISSSFLDKNGTLSKKIMPDLLHPDVKGYDLWAKAMQPHLEKLLKSSKAPGANQKLEAK